MKSQEKIKQLRSIIKKELTPLISHDYWLLEVPYYPNVGDALIWKGELDFLKRMPYRCKGTSSYETPIPSTIKKDDVILLQGGGNFGDLWEHPQNYRNKVIERYPDNSIIILPQSAYWENEQNMITCAEFMKKHMNVIICARDNYTYELLRRNFRNQILLVPDMAFCIDTTEWDRPKLSQKTLLLKRSDKEQKTYAEIENLMLEKNLTICDWLPFSEDAWQKDWLRRTKKYFPFLNSWYAQHFYLPYMVHSGVQLIGSHKKIYSTRLHAAILSILLGKGNDLIWFDNSYGKNFNFYETWLSDLDGITFIR
jgi:pyruvyl transferase EpsO